MEKDTFKDRFLKEIGKKGFLKALGVFFFCVIVSLVTGFVYDTMELAITLGIGLGIIWMGVAYFNQEEEEES